MQLYADGGAMPNPGDKAIAVTDHNGKVLIAKRTGYGTNNEAEYEAVIEAFKFAKEKEVFDVVVYTDSSLVMNHLNGIWKHDEKFESKLVELRALMKEFSKSLLVYIRSNKNLADGAVKALLAGKEVEIETSDTLVPISLPVVVGQAYKPEGDVDFTVHIDYRNQTLAVWVEPNTADMKLVQGVMQIALLELRGVDTDKMHRAMLKTMEKVQKKRETYTV